MTTRSPDASARPRLDAIVFGAVAVTEPRRVRLGEVLAPAAVVDVAGAELVARVGAAFRPFL